MTHGVLSSPDIFKRRKESGDMEDKNTFLGVNRGTITIIGVIVAICAPALTMIVTVIGLFSMMNSSINRLDNNITALRSELKADIAALRSEQKSDIAELRADVVELKLTTTEISVRVEEIERRMPQVESVDGRLDALERGQARLNERVDAPSAE